ncbi:MAG: flagella basal body P-ring formation protein FlgA [Armatimonadota bacterium]|nr:flagella basal body P-ring formation protein FlgA [Armatimonadota bacterium]MDR7438860.1 flagella basal body P-ring formation protein FlgA [Armatimonadota bacterium]MDR7562401.1 flagella basal body P-ring formation protein FlgA [Armatimonadota bacterium]MDR7568664.1 flagella basal body P-ring formation protein FlgA [Armatimonadota bacterium]MDR7601481.1 flagella basal body P-ring formation protein FlgA [Armatimonadota bacterium]
MKPLLLAGLLLALAASPGTVTVRLRSSALVDDPEVTLGEIASLAGPERMVRALEQAVVRVDLRPGQTLRLSAREVLETLVQAGFDAGRIRLVGAQEVLVRRTDRSAAVRRGSSVRVVAAVGAIRVSAPGVALESGDPGQAIRVRVIPTRREVVARVVQPELVAVVF